MKLKHFYCFGYLFTYLFWRYSFLHAPFVLFFSIILRSLHFVPLPNLLSISSSWWCAEQHKYASFGKLQLLLEPSYKLLCWKFQHFWLKIMLKNWDFYRAFDTTLLCYFADLFDITAKLIYLECIFFDRLHALPIVFK